MTTKQKHIRPALIVAIAGTAAVVLALLTYAVLCGLGPKLPLMRMNQKNVSAAPLVVGRDLDGSEYHVYFTGEDASAQKYSMIRVRENKGGLWTAEDCASFPKGDSSRVATLQWSVETYAFSGDEAQSGTQWHYLYGYAVPDTVTRQPNFRDGQLPQAVAVELMIDQDACFVHLITYLPPEEMEKIDVPELLRQNGCIRRVPT